MTNQVLGYRLTGPVAAQARKREHEKKYLKKFGFTTIWSRVVGVLQKKKIGEMHKQFKYSLCGGNKEGTWRGWDIEKPTVPTRATQRFMTHSTSTWRPI